jgi:ubiquinone/menaquinone biosynthesis C-methylase UbiE
MARREVVDVFDADVAAHGGYVYTAVPRWSTRYATGRQSQELVRMLLANFPRSIRIVDIGCGDGTYTFDIAKGFGPMSIRGVEPASNAVDAARANVPPQFSESISFEVGSIYDVESQGESVAVVRGVLHHLDKPQAAIAQLTRQFPALVVLEPNGYNPALKILEKASPYHREHQEKSYWPPTLNRWFIQEGFTLVERKFLCLVPYFFPTLLAKVLSRLDPVVESVPGMRELCCGTNLALYRKAENSDVRG